MYLVTLYNYITGEGLDNLLFLITQLCQAFENEKVFH